MGIFDFLTGAGKKLDEGGAPPPPSGGPTPEQMQQLRAAQDRARGAQMVKMVEEHAFKVSDLGIAVSGETVKVTGAADTQETREKVVLLLGNVHGVAKVDDQMTVSAPPVPPAVFHTVAKGETLGKIAKQYYGNANAYNKIFEANKPMLKDADHIYPGQVLRIPDAKVAEKP